MKTYPENKIPNLANIRFGKNCEFCNAELEIMDPLVCKDCKAALKEIVLKQRGISTIKE